MSTALMSTGRSDPSTSAARVLHLTRDFPPRCNGGLSVAVGQLWQAEARAGLRSLVVSFDGWRPSRGGAGTTRGEAAPPPAGPVARITTLGEWERWVDTVQLSKGTVLNVHDPLLWSYGAQLAKHFGLSTVCTVHVWYPGQDEARRVPSTRSSAALLRALQGADAIVAPSSYLRRAICARLPEVADKLHVCGLGWGSKAPNGPQGGRADLPRGRSVLFAGRFSDVKGVLVLFDALASLFCQVPEATLVVAGGLPESPSAERRWRRRLLERVPSRHHGRIEWRGWLDADALAEAYGQAGVVVVPSLLETFGLSALEAMAAGCPTVASDAGALPELLTHGDSGHLVRSGDAVALAEGLAAVLNDAAYARRLGERAAMVADETWRWEAVLPAWLTTYAHAGGATDR